jgi:hypothetical protein
MRLMQCDAIRFLDPKIVGIDKDPLKSAYLLCQVSDISVGFKLYTIAYAYEQATSWYDLHLNL